MSPNYYVHFRLLFVWGNPAQHVWTDVVAKQLNYFHKNADFDYQTMILC